MKRIFTLLLALLMAVTMVTACQNTPPPEGDDKPTQTPVTPPELEYDGTVIVKPGEPTTPPEDGEDQPDDPTTPPEGGEDQPDDPTTPPEDGEDQPDDPTTPPESGDQPTTPPDSGDVVEGNFVTKYKTYTYEGNNLAIIKLENHTTQNYTVTINAKYLDAAGNELKAETQTFEGFPAGWENHLVFKPDFPFAKFTYTVDLNVYQGECAISAETKAKVTRVYETKIWIMSQVNQGDYTKYPTILAEAEWENASGIYAKRCVVIFDNTGEIYAILYKNGTISQSPETVGYYLLQTTDETIVWPEELKGNVTGIVAITSITK